MHLRNELLFIKMGFVPKVLIVSWTTCCDLCKPVGWMLLRVNFKDDFVDRHSITEWRSEPKRREVNLAEGYFHSFAPFGEVHFLLTGCSWKSNLGWKMLHIELTLFLAGWTNPKNWQLAECCSAQFLFRVSSETPPERYSVFLSYESSMCKTAIEYRRVPFQNASHRGGKIHG